MLPTVMEILSVSAVKNCKILADTTGTAKEIVTLTKYSQKREPPWAKSNPIMKAKRLMQEESQHFARTDGPSGLHVSTASWIITQLLSRNGISVLRIPNSNQTYEEGYLVIKLK